MNEVFNLKRFWLYFKNDFLNAKDYYWISLLVYGLMPVILFIFYFIFRLILGPGDETDPSGFYMGMKISTYVICFFGLVISFPIKVYGSITDKRYGTNWILVPASTFEKYLSMLIMCCIVAPVIFYAIFYGCSYILKLIIPGYGDPVGLSILLKKMMEMSDNTVSFSIMTIPFCWWENILVFLLGAICFKKGKGGKTILCLMGLGMAISLASSIFFLNADYPDWIDNITPEQGLFWLNFIINVLYLIVFGILLSCIYLRVKTIKH